MPQLGLEVTEGDRHGATRVRSATAVSQDQPLVELETDKAITEVLAPGDGVVRAIECELGQTVPVGAVLARLADSADEPLDSDARAGRRRRPLDAVAAALRRPSPCGARPPAPDATARRPVARRAAATSASISAGRDRHRARGRVTLDDVAAPPPTARRPPVPARHEARRGGRQELTATRRAIARADDRQPGDPAVPPRPRGRRTHT